MAGGGGGGGGGGGVGGAGCLWMRMGTTKGAGPSAHGMPFRVVRPTYGQEGPLLMECPSGVSVLHGQQGRRPWNALQGSCGGVEEAAVVAVAIVLVLRTRGPLNPLAWGPWDPLGNHEPIGPREVLGPRGTPWSHDPAHLHAHLTRILGSGGKVPKAKWEVR